MTDYRAWEIQATLDEARASEVAGWCWFGVALVLTVAAGATATSSHVLSVALAAWACWPLWLAVTRWIAAADDREIAAWMGGAA